MRRIEHRILAAVIIVIIGLILAPLLRGQGVTSAPALPRLVLKWEPTSSWGTGPVGGYKVYQRVSDSQDWAEVAYVETNEWPIATPSGGLAGYAWRVTAWNGLESDPTPEASIDRPGTPGTPRIIIEIR